MLPHASFRRALLALLMAGSFALTGCGGGSSSSDKSPAEVMAQAKKTLDDTSGVQITLSTDNLPEGVQGITRASGVGTHAPAFDGSITVMLSGQPFDVPVVAVDGKVYAQIPLTPGWQDVDPSEYGAPDPAQLMSTDHGFSSLLSATTGVQAGDSVRGGKDNKEVLTKYTGTVPDTAVKNVIPSASGDFDATYTITDSGELRTATLTGVFYAHSDPMTYTIGFDGYGTDKQITAP
ncbi:MAG: LppX_LprAFG lipoprotein [Nocardioides sp.]